MSLPESARLLGQRIVLLLIPSILWFWVYSHLKKHQILCLSSLYQYICCAISTFAPANYIYTSTGSHMLEKLHRTRFLAEYALAPVLLWALFWPILFNNNAQSTSSESPLLPLISIMPLLGGGLLLIAHLWAAWQALAELRADYPFTPETKLAVLQWKPARCSPRVLAPVRLINWGLRIFFLLKVIFCITPGWVRSDLTGLPPHKSLGPGITQAILAFLAAAMYQGLCVNRRGTDNEQHFVARNAVEFFIVVLLKH